MELHIALTENNSYNALADGCHEICYQTGARFEWVYPEVEGWAIAQFRFRNAAQATTATKMLVDLWAAAPIGSCRLLYNAP